MDITFRVLSAVRGTKQFDNSTALTRLRTFRVCVPDHCCALDCWALFAGPDSRHGGLQRARLKQGLASVGGWFGGIDEQVGVRSDHVESSHGDKREFEWC